VSTARGARHDQREAELVGARRALRVRVSPPPLQWNTVCAGVGCEGGAAAVGGALRHHRGHAMTAVPRADARARAVPARDVLQHLAKAACVEDSFHV